MSAEALSSDLHDIRESIFVLNASLSSSHLFRQGNQLTAEVESCEYCDGAEPWITQLKGHSTQPLDTVSVL